MTSVYQFPDLQLPWSSSSRENKRFGVLAALLLLVVMIGGIIVQTTQLPEKSREELEKLPPQLAKVILKKKEEPPPPPPPKVEEKKPEPKKEEPKKEEPKKEEPKPVEVQKAREKAKQSGLLAMQDDLAAMRDAFAPPPPSQQLAKGSSQAVEVKRSVIMGSATKTSGGIQTAAVPRATGVASLEGRDVTQVDSVTLGGSTVDTGGDVGQATASRAEGVRSEEHIRAVLDQNKGALYAIYNRALRANPALQGKVTFELTIEPDGSVSACRIVSSELKDSALESRLVSRMQMINFGAEPVASIKTRWAIDFLPY
ncbi:MAG TPA: AgmX/PglI C-terminal domain-containing protein [Pseudomonadales bacterium]